MREGGRNIKRAQRLLSISLQRPPNNCSVRLLLPNYYCLFFCKRLQMLDSFRGAEWPVPATTFSIYICIDSVRQNMAAREQQDGSFLKKPNGIAEYTRTRTLSCCRHKWNDELLDRLEGASDDVWRRTVVSAVLSTDRIEWCIATSSILSPRPNLPPNLFFLSFWFVDT